MRLITRQSKADGAAARYKDLHGSRHSPTYPALVELGEHPNPDDVDRLLGNDSWTKLELCHECQTQKTAVVELGDPPYYDSQTVWLCKECVQKALELF